MDNNKHIFSYIKNSKFLRSIFLQVLAIFLVVSIAIVGIVFYSFAAEINKNIISNRQKQLFAIENTISSRMDELSSISYNIGIDPTFYLEPVAGKKYSGYEMSNTLSRYLIGNDFIEFIAYYRLSEPEKIYTSSGELTFQDFWNAYLHFNNYTEEEYLSLIKNSLNTQVIPLSTNNDEAYFSYICSLPQFSTNPQAFIVMIVPLSELKPLIDTLLMNNKGKLIINDASGKELYQISTLDEDVQLSYETINNMNNEKFLSYNGKQYVIHKQVSESNGWSFISIIALADVISVIANKQLLFIVLLLVLMFVAIIVMLFCIIIQYKPISNLATSIRDKSIENPNDELIDEGSLLSNKFATLKDDSEQKQKFETAFNEANAASKAKSAFLSSISHDIRTPMNAIIGMTSIAYSHSNEPTYVKECLQKVQIASQYLLDIINNVLDMSKIESGKFTLSEEITELPKSIYGLITILNQSIEEKHQHFIVEAENIENETIICDNVRLTQVFVNLLSNSIKYTPDGGTIILKISQDISKDMSLDNSIDVCKEIEYANYTITCTDTGIGMSPDFVEQVFDTFTRAQDVNVTRTEGTGLGMAITKNLVELMGGTIKCESELGKGTTFTVKLRLKLANTKNEEKITIDYNKYSKIPVLILGKNERSCKNQVKAFSNVGANAIYTVDIATASNMLHQASIANNPYQLVIINQFENDKNGIKVISQIKKVSDYSETTFILAAKDLGHINQIEAKKFGINAFVQIPLFKSSVLRILNKAFDIPDSLEKINKSKVNLEGKRILLVEDNSINREIATRILHETKAEICAVTNGKEAVDAFVGHDEGYFDIILMDLHMPVMNGYEATTIIRSLNRADAIAIPIYAMTANVFDEDVRQVKDIGMNGHIGKPYTPDMLYRMLREAIK